MKNRVAIALLLLMFAAVAQAQTPPAAPAAVPPDPPAMNIPRTDAPITLDGDLSDAGWQGAAVIDQFYETSPGNNVPAKVKTVAYLTYDARNFYIGVRADDPNPRSIRAPYVDRDAVIGTDDNIAVFLDTRNDRRTAIELRVNPRGIQGDGIFNDANGNEDFSPDFYYDTAARIDDKGWSAEYRIPFSSLRYGSSDPQTWNILVWRNYPRDYRYAFHSAPIARGSNCLVCHTHPLVGLTGLPAASHLITAPYVTAQAVEQPEGGDIGLPLERGDSKFDAGVDVKWTPTQTAAIDLTLNPDFSQVEADIPQITANERFAVFFQEKRPFFLEGFDLFDTPLQVTYTRNITEPLFGSRLTGKSGNTAYTVLLTKDEGGGLTIIPGTYGSNFAPVDFKSYATIGRVRHDIGASFVGAVLTDREISGGGHNRVFGPDGQWRPSQSDAITAQILFSDTKNPNRIEDSPIWNGESSRSHAFYSSWFRQKRGYDAGAEVRDVGDGFRADLGFIPQVGFREFDASFGLRFFPEHSKFFRFLRPNVFLDHQTDRDNNTIYQVASFGFGGFGIKNLNFNIIFRPEEKVRARPGGPLLSQTYGIFNVQFDPSRRIPRVALNTRFGEQIAFGAGKVGRGVSLNFTGTFRPIDRLDLQLLVARQWLDVLSDRLFTADVQRLRAQYSFSNRSLVRVITQYDKTEPVASFGGSFLGSVLYSYKLNWQTVLFVGYGDNRTLVADDQVLNRNHLFPAERSLFVKLSYAILK